MVKITVDTYTTNHLYSAVRRNVATFNTILPAYFLLLKLVECGGCLDCVCLSLVPVQTNNLATVDLIWYSE